MENAVIIEETKTANPHAEVEKPDFKVIDDDYDYKCNIISEAAENFAEICQSDLSDDLKTKANNIYRLIREFENSYIEVSK